MIRLIELDHLNTGVQFSIKIVGLHNIYKLLTNLGFKMSQKYSSDEVAFVCFSPEGINAGVGEYHKLSNEIILNRLKIPYDLLKNLIVLEIYNHDDTMVSLCYESYLNC